MYLKIMNNRLIYNRIMESVSKTVKQILNENECKHQSSTSIGEPITQFYRGHEIEISRFRCDRCKEEFWGFTIDPYDENYYAEEGYDTDTEAFNTAKMLIDRKRY